MVIMIKHDDNRSHDWQVAYAKQHANDRLQFSKCVSSGSVATCLMISGRHLALCRMQQNFVHSYPNAAGVCALIP